VNDEGKSPSFIDSKLFADTRGWLKKLEISAGALPNFTVAEILVSRSTKGVIRGFHYQTGSSAGPKVVWCISGRILDVCFEVKDPPRSPQDLHPVTLDADSAPLVLPSGFGHGFECLSEECIVVYLLSRRYQPHEDEVVHYSSFGRWWSVDDPIVSTRDSSASRFGV